MHRRDLSSLSESDRAQLADLIEQYATPAVVQQHINGPPGLHTSGTVFLSWHRAYLGGLEAFLVAQGQAQWSPLPAWNPATPIPSEFNRPDSGRDALVDLTPNVSFSPDFDEPALASFTSDDELGMALMGPHGTVHVQVGGVMADFRSPSAPIFWPWHSFVDDIWWAWQRLSVVVPDCGGMTLTQARAALTAAGLVVGAATVQPHREWPFALPPDASPTLHWHPGGGFHLHPTRSSPPRPKHLHRVVDQMPEEGRMVQSGTAVDLVLGSA